LLQKHEKKSAGVREWNPRENYDTETKAKALAFLDSLGDEGTRVQRLQQTVAKKREFRITSVETLKKWDNPNSRAKIEKQLQAERSDVFISSFAPGFDARALNPGGSGKKAVGRGKFRLTGRRPAKYELMEEKLIGWFSLRRTNGLACTSRAMRNEALRWMAQVYPIPDGEEGSGRGNSCGFRASQGWFRRFMARHGLVWRRKNDNSPVSTAELLPTVADFCNKLRQLRMKNPRGNDPWGRFSPRNTYDVDQVPLPFASCYPRTLEYRGKRRVWIKAAGSGLDKRQCTLQLLIRAEGKQPKPTLIFRGAPLHDKTLAWRRKERELETSKYDPDCRVLWQKKAWADTATNVHWVGTSFDEQIEDEHGDNGEDILLLCDNLSSQVADPFKAEIEHYGPTLRFGPKKATHLWQPVDHHVGARYKFLMARKYDDFMAYDIQAYPWGKVPTPERRRLLTVWAGDAWRQLEKERVAREEAHAKDPSQPHSLFYRAFQRTGCIITRDGTGDEEIRPNQDVTGDQLARFQAMLKTPDQLRPRPNEEDFIINLDTTSEDESEEDEHKHDSECEGQAYEDSEDEDDELPDGAKWGDDDGESSDDGEREPVDEGAEIVMESEVEKIRAARNIVIENGNEVQLGDFDVAHRIAKQFGNTEYSAEHALASTSKQGRKRKARFANLNF
jgi:hypothetical protein